MKAGVFSWTTHHASLGLSFFTCEMGAVSLGIGNKRNKRFLLCSLGVVCQRGSQQPLSPLHQQHIVSASVLFLPPRPQSIILFFEVAIFTNNENSFF